MQAHHFVKRVIKDIKEDTGVAAAWRRADNPATEYQSWEMLAKLGIDLDKEDKRLPYTTVAAAIAKAKITEDGALGIGRALADYYEDGSENQKAKLKLRRLLACDSVKEICRILRSIFNLIQSKNKLRLNFSQILDELLKFNWDKNRQDIKSRCAQDFYRINFQEKDEPL